MAKNKKAKLAKEIERRFLLNHLPSRYEEYSKLRITQGYVLSSKEGNLRIRRIAGHGYFQTVKRKNNSYSIEVEIPI